jgi:DNA-binding MarR family transcriptional regulator
MSDRGKKSHIDTIARNCIAARLRQVNRAVTSVYDRALRPLGLKVSQLNILVCTAKLGLAHRGQVCGYLMLESSTLSRNVERMRRRGWLEVLPGGDARTAPFRLTPSGERLLERAFPVWEKAQQQALELVGGDAIDCIAQAAKRLRPPAGS